MPKKKVNLDEEAPKAPEKPELEELLEEKENMIAEDEAAEADKIKQEEEEAKIPTEEVDLDAEKEQTKKEAREEIEKEVVEPLRKEIIDLKKAIAPEEQDEYDQFIKKYKAEHGDDVPDYKIFMEFATQKSEERLQQRQKEEQEAKEKAETEEKTKNEEQINENFRVWTQQLNDLEAKGLIPQMAKPEKGDKGFDARVKMYGLMQSTWNKDGESPVTNMYEVLTKFGDQMKGSEEVAGADAPISMGDSANSGADDDQDYSYAEIHRGAQDLEGFATKVLNKVGFGKN